MFYNLVDNENNSQLFMRLCGQRRSACSWRRVWAWMWRTAWGKQPLISAAEHGFLDGLQLLLKSRADKDLTDNEGNTALISAAANKQSFCVRCLLQARAIPDARNQSGKTALIYSAIHGSDDNVTLLLRCGADRNLCDRNGRTALDSAKSNGHWKVVPGLWSTIL